MIYCVVPEELVPELFDRLNDYYADDPHVEVIVDRRKSGGSLPAGGERRSRPAGPPAAAIPRAAAE